MLGKKKRNSKPKDVAKYKRQKCIQLMEKILKNLFRMFRNEETKEHLKARFLELKGQLDALDDVELHATYHREMRKYIHNFEHIICGHKTIEELQGPHMTQLNRLQKLKNATSYKRKKQ